MSNIDYKALAEMVTELHCLYILEKTKDSKIFGGEGRSMKIFNQYTRNLEKEIFDDGRVVKYE